MVNPLEIESYWILRVSKYINGIFLLTLKHCWILDIHLVVSSSIEYININKTGIYHSLWKAHKMKSFFWVSDWAILQEGLYSKCFFLKKQKGKARHCALLHAWNASTKEDEEDEHEVKARLWQMREYLYNRNEKIRTILKIDDLINLIILMTIDVIFILQLFDGSSHWFS